MTGVKTVIKINITADFYIGGSIALVNLRKEMAEGRRRQTLCDKRDNNSV